VTLLVVFGPPVAAQVLGWLASFDSSDANDT
jgi:hypothetical protein